VKAKSLHPNFKGTLHRAQGPGVPAATPPSPPPVKKPRKKALLSVLAFLRGFSPSGGSWSRPPSLPGHRSPLSRLPCSSTPEKHCHELKHSLFAANNGATIMMRGFFSLLGCPWPPRRAQRALRPGFWALVSRSQASGCFSASASGALRSGLLHPAPCSKNGESLVPGLSALPKNYQPGTLPRIQEPATQTGKPPPQKESQT
jgi:hypothetical protein